MKKYILLLVWLLTSLITMQATDLTHDRLSIIPSPVRIVPGDGEFC